MCECASVRVCIESHSFVRPSVARKNIHPFYCVHTHIIIIQNTWRGKKIEQYPLLSICCNKHLNRLYCIRLFPYMHFARVCESLWAPAGAIAIACYLQMEYDIYWVNRLHWRAKQLNAFIFISNSKALKIYRTYTLFWYDVTIHTTHHSHHSLYFGPRMRWECREWEQQHFTRLHNNAHKWWLHKAITLTTTQDQVLKAIQRRPLVTLHTLCTIHTHTHNNTYW